MKQPLYAFGQSLSKSKRRSRIPVQTKANSRRKYPHGGRAVGVAGRRVQDGPVSLYVCYIDVVCLSTANTRLNLIFHFLSRFFITSFLSVTTAADTRFASNTDSGFLLTSQDKIVGSNGP